MELTSTTVGGWATIIAVAGGIYYISNRKEKSKRPAAAKQTSKPLEVKKESKAKKGKKASLQSDGDSEVKSGSDKKKKAKKPSPAPVKAQSAQSEQSTYADVTEDKEEQDNKEFARRMAATKAGGAIGTSNAKVETRQKSVKQSRAQEKQEKKEKPGVEFSSDNLTAPSSTNGGDADDDQSPINSPELSATTDESHVGGGVADMLEKPSAGPSVLKISAPTNPAPEKKQKTQAPAAPAESKKQRQNRQKAEAQKAQREADEAERQKLMEQSRRNARLAEGRAAKDGSGFMASKTPAYASQWSAPPPSTNGTTTSDKKVQLLDTNEPTEKPAEPTAEAVYSPSQEAGSKWETNLSEEDQIRIFAENENWETVKNDKKKRAKKAEESSADDESKDFGVPPKTTPSQPGQKYQVKTVHVETEGGKKKVVERDVELQDDEWEVS